MNREKLIRDLMDRHEEEKVTYTCCTQNGCWDANCILKVRTKNGKLTAIETDDSINANRGREDAYLTKEQIDQGMVQQRPCVMGHSWKGEIDAPTRITKPLKRVGGRGHGNGHFVEISWDEAIDTIAAKIKETVELFGENSILHTHLTFFEFSSFPLNPYFKGAIASWSDHSVSGTLAGEKAHLGYEPAKNVFAGQGKSLVGYEAPDLFNSKLIVLWGWDPLVGWHGSVSYYLKLAKERGAKIIVIEPRYTLSTEVLADQWIPIRPGTDAAMMLAVAQVFYEEKLWDRAFVDRFVEPEGFEKFRRYLMGEEDGEVKSPEWAEEICAVPAETIRAFARLYAASAPVHLQCHYSVSKRHYGEYATTASILLQAMTGNIARPGGCESGSVLVTPTHFPSLPDVNAEFNRANREFTPHVCMVNNKLAEAVTLRPKYDAGEITEAEYRAAIGCPEGSPLPNIQFVFFGNNWLNNLQDLNKRLKAASMLHFTCGLGWHINSPTVQFMDIVIPAPIHQLESTDPFHLDAKRFRTGPGGMNNYMFYCGKALNPPGEIRPVEWFWTQIANKLGVGEKYNPKLKDVPWDKWDEEVEKLYRAAYEKWIKDENGALQVAGIELKPWEEFLKNPVIRVPIDEPFHAFKNTIADGTEAFLTPSGKIEFYSGLVADTDISKRWGGKIDPLPRWKPSYMTEPPRDSYFSPRTRNYPLSMVTPVSLYRDLSCHDQNPLLRDCYNHRLWISPADAKKRGIRDNDAVEVFNEYGRTHMRAYVTSKIIPGTVAIHFGAWYMPDENKTEDMPYGMDTRGSCNFLIGDVHLPHVVNSILTAGLVEVKKLGGNE
ncbi:MAG: molybdopterin-dependent oxidoreductase [Syntrophales bacterium]|jgi:anaerobic dimethyl sulfoxide reductase subunit A|nr:molybdopterin-dependent oxidoreductase [Syntrophales bacterium]